MNDTYDSITGKKVKRSNLNLKVVTSKSTKMATINHNPKQSIPFSPQGYMSVTQFAKANGVTPNKVYNWVRRGKLDTYKMAIFGINRVFVNEVQPNLTKPVTRVKIVKQAVLNSNSGATIN